GRSAARTPSARIRKPSRAERRSQARARAAMASPEPGWVEISLPVPDPVWLLPAAALILYIVVATRCAWHSDDAYISFRSVANFVHGQGLVWNVGERAQAFTHTLWFLLVSAGYVLTGEV